MLAESGSKRRRAGSYPNLFDAHPPFQIDGNFGGAAGIGEMLVQSHKYIDILPALPAALPEGSKRHLCKRRFCIGYKMENGKLLSLEVTSTYTKSCHLKYGKYDIRFPAERGKTYRLNGQLQLQRK